MRKQLLTFRLLTAVGQLGLLFAGHWLGFAVDKPWVWWVPLVYLLLVMASYFWLPRRAPSKWQLLLDLVVWIAFFALLNGISNPLIWCLMLPILLAGLSQSIGFTWLMALLSNLSYVLLWFITPNSADSMHTGHEPFNAHVIGMWVGFVLISLLISYITTRLMQVIHRKNRQLVAIEQQRAEDQHIMTMATMATGLAHELGTPLNSIKLLASELMNDVANEQTRHDDLTEIDAQVTRCQTTIREMAELASDPDYLNSRITDIRTLLHDLMKRFKQSHPDILVSIHAQEQPVASDALLELSLLNVLNNSVAAKADRINIVAETRDNHIQLKISDNGLGQSAHQSDGLGIGLKLSRRILRSAGGSLDLTTHPQGAEVLVTLARIES